MNFTLFTCNFFIKTSFTKIFNKMKSLVWEPMTDDPIGILFFFRLVWNSYILSKLILQLKRKYQSSMVQLYKIFDIYMVYYSSKYIIGVLDSSSIFRGCYKKIFLQNYKILNDLCRIISEFFHEVRVKRKRKLIIYSNTSEYTFCTSTSINGGVDTWLKIF